VLDKEGILWPTTLIRRMRIFIQYLLIILIFSVPLAFSHATTEVYGLIKVVMIELFGLILLVLSLIQYITSDRPVTRPPTAIRRLIYSFFIIACISLVNAVNIHAGLAYLYLLAAYLVIFFIILRHIEGIFELRRLIFSALLAGVVACAWSIYQSREAGLFASRYIYASTFGNPIFFSQYLSVMIPLSLAMMLSESRTQPKLALFLKYCFYLGAVGISLLLLIVARSRGAYLGLASMIVYCTIAAFIISAKRIKRILLSVSIILIILAVSVGAVLWPNVQASVKEREFQNLMRAHVWSSSMNLIKDHPVLGVGSGNFQYVYPFYRTEKEKEATPKGIKYTKAHNVLLHVWSEMGIFGILVFLGIIFYVFRASFRVVLDSALDKLGPRSNNISKEGFLVIGITAAMVSLLVQSLFNPMLEVPTSAFTFWLLLAFLFVIARSRTSQATPSSPSPRILRIKKQAAGTLCVALVLFAPVNVLRPLICDYFLEKAQLAEKDGDLKKTISDLEQGLSAYPHNWKALFLSGKIHQKTGSFKEAAKYYGKAVQYHPNYSVIWNNLGSVYVQDLRIYLAIEAFKQAIRIDDKYIGAHYNLSLAYERNGDAHLAKMHMEEAEKIDPAFLGNMYLELGIFDKAALEFHKTLNRNPDNVEAHFKLAQVWQGRNEIAKAIDMYNTTIKLQPFHMMAHLQLGDIYLESGELNKAIASYKKALDAYPYQVEKVSEDILFFGDSGIYPQVLEGYDQLESLRRIKLRSNLTLGHIYKAKGQTQMAMRQFEEVRKGKPDDKSIWLELAEIYAEQGMYEEARDSYSNLIEIDPDQEQILKKGLLRLERIAAHHALARIFEDQGMIEKAAEEYRSVLGFYKDSIHTLLNLARIYTKKGEYVKAERHLSEILEIAPENIEAHLGVGDMFYQMGSPIEAKQKYTYVIDNAPYDVRAYLGLGLVYRQQERLRRALEVYERALGLSPEEVRLHLAMATLMEEMGDIDRAVTEYREALNIDPENKEAMFRLDILE